ncbi:hypothetical protein DFJ74DRAFT_656327 [Hyaloraphidium curvatum]|nr:hypothetical protein DFJ74DRAFT_656327 [Hyaloraphidium curvatum]
MPDKGQKSDSEYDSYDSEIEDPDPVGPVRDSPKDAFLTLRCPQLLVVSSAFVSFGKWIKGQVSPTLATSPTSPTSPKQEREASSATLPRRAAGDRTSQPTRTFSLSSSGNERTAAKRDGLDALSRGSSSELSGGGRKARPIAGSGEPAGPSRDRDGEGTATIPLPLPKAVDSAARGPAADSDDSDEDMEQLSRVLSGMENTHTAAPRRGSNEALKPRAGSPFAPRGDTARPPSPTGLQASDRQRGRSPNPRVVTNPSHSLPSPSSPTTLPSPEKGAAVAPVFVAPDITATDKEFDLGDLLKDAEHISRDVDDDLKPASPRQGKSYQDAEVMAMFAPLSEPQRPAKVVPAEEAKPEAKGHDEQHHGTMAGLLGAMKASRILKNRSRSREVGSVAAGVHAEASESNSAFAKLGQKMDERTEHVEAVMLKTEEMQSSSKDFLDKIKQFNQMNEQKSLFPKIRH